MADIVKTTRKRRSKTVDMSTSPADSTTEGALTAFTLFPKLPTELRLKIWKLAAAPRWVVIGQRKVPGIFHACVESRKESKYDFRIHRPIKPYLADVGLGILVNYKTDILYFDYFHRMSGNPFYIFCVRWPQLLKPVLRLAFSLMEIRIPCNAVQEWYPWRTAFWVGLEELCPNLVELIVMVRRGPLGSDFDDLYEVDQVPAGVTANKDLVLSTLQNEQARGYWKDLKLTFMRNETWER